MQVRVNFKLFLFIILFYLTMQLETYFILMVFTALHEIAHIIVGLLLGFKINKIDIMPMGFSISLKNEKSFLHIRKTRIKKIVIALAGPIFNLLVAIIFIFFNKIDNSIREVLIYSNLLICLFNLLPIYPLDGGRILKQTISLIKNNTKDTIKICESISMLVLIVLTVIGSIAVLYYENIAIFLILCFLWAIFLKENKKNKLRLRAYNLLEKNKEVGLEK